MKIPRTFTVTFIPNMIAAGQQILAAAAAQFTESEQRFVSEYAPKLRRFVSIDNESSQMNWTGKVAGEFKTLEVEADKLLALAGVPKERRQVLNYCCVDLHPDTYLGSANMNPEEIIVHIKTNAMNGTFDALYKLSLAYPVPAKVKEFFAEVKELSDSIKEEELAAV